MKLLFFLFLVFPTFAFASPAVNSFAANSSSVNFGAIITFSWSLSDAGGSTFKIPCQTGFKFFNSNGSTFACGVPVSFSSSSSGSVDIIAYNLSGNNTSFSAALTPKDPTGTAYDYAARTAYVNVAPLSQPITNFSFSAAAENTFILSWTAPYLDGVNLQIPCVDGIKAFSPSYAAAAYLPCGVPIFSTDLGPNSGITLNFINTNTSSVNYKLALLPAMAPGLYDGTHAANLIVSIPSGIVGAPVITWFSASTTSIISGQSTLISWDIKNAVGANLKIDCSYGITASSTLNGGAVLPCGDLAYSSALPASGSATLTFNNKYSSNQPVKISLLPSSKNGEYNGTLAKEIYVYVNSTGQTPNAPPPAGGSAPAYMPTPININQYTPQTTANHNIMITLWLKRGSRGAEVAALQELLKTDPSVYPEGMVTGYFGELTEKAVQKFQIKYGIVSSGTPLTTGYGATGPRTRLKLNSL